MQLKQKFIWKVILYINYGDSVRQIREDKYVALDSTCIADVQQLINEICEVENKTGIFIFSYECIGKEDYLVEEDIIS